MRLRLTPWWFALLAVGCGAAGKLHRVESLEDRRALGELPALSTDEAPAVRARALRALGRLQQRGSVAPVRAALGGGVDGPRCEAARAAGLLGMAWDVRFAAEAAEALTGPLLDAERAEGSGPCRGAQLEALGRLGTKPALARLGEVLAESATSEELFRRAALAVGVALKRVGGEGAPEQAVSALSDRLPLLSSADARFAAAYALRIVKGTAPLPALRACLSDASGDVRALCVRGVGERGDPADLLRLAAALDDPSPRVAVQAVRALATRASGCTEVTCPPLIALEKLAAHALARAATSGAWQPVLALLQAPLPSAARPLLVSLRTSLAAAPSVLDCRAAAALDRFDGRLVEARTCGRGEVPEPLRWRLALSELSQSGAAPRPRAEAALALLGHEDRTVRNAAVGLLAELGWEAAAPALRARLSDEDPVVASSAAAALGKLKDTASGVDVLALAGSERLPAEVRPVLAEALGALRPSGAEPLLRRWLTDPAPALRLAAAEALKPEGQPGSGVPAVPRAEEAAWRPLSGVTQLEIATNRGTIWVVLDTAEAPRTSAFIASLAEAGFYDGLSVHRVVPDFVGQGGDPRGDGEGGPGQTLRCELNAHPYTRGTVGMALSGPDTGGSQFFFTHSAQPHLDGRYTAFGQVTSGQEVVDSLLEGDTFVRIRVRH